MKKRGGRPTFTEIVDQAQRDSERRVAVARDRGLYSDDFGELELVDDTGAVYRCVDDRLDAAEAHQLALSGAGLVWDPCGCGGGCGMTWLSPEEIRSAAAMGPPKIVHKPPRHIGSISKWAAIDGRIYLLAEEKVVWGERLA